MQALRSHLALLLLLCLVRTMLPEAWLLALHPHAHTTDEPAAAPAFKQQGKALLSARHQHCGIEQFYNVAYQAAGPVAVPRFHTVPGYSQSALALTVRPIAAALPRLLAQRGPPCQA